MKIVIIILLSINLFAQEANKNIDSVRNIYTSVKEGRYQSDNNEKCGFALVNRYASQRINSARLEKPTSTRPETEKFAYSPSLYFKLHYDDIGFDSVQFNVQELLIALDSIYAIQIDQLGYLPPPSDTLEGGDSSYDIYIQDLGPSLYGYTELENVIEGGFYTSFIVIDNNYTGFYTEGIEGAKVTCAHEFHHAIQLGRYGYLEKETYFHELSSTAMEEFTFDYINDYYGYIGTFFSSPNKSLNSYSGYDIALWNIFLQQNFGNEILRRQWELVQNNNSTLSAISQSILESGSTLTDELNEFGIWCYFTGFRAVTSKYFEEASNYNLIRPLSRIPVIKNGETVIEMNSPPVANNFLFMDNENDTLVVVITNADIEANSLGTSANQPYAFTLFNYENPIATKINSSYSFLFSHTNNSKWKSGEILNGIVFRDTTIQELAESSTPYPMPFILTKNVEVNIPIKTKNNTNVEYKIFSSAMNSVFEGSSNSDFLLINGDYRLVKWNGKDNSNKNVASGIYFYLVRVGNDEFSGKLVVFNE